MFFVLLVPAQGLRGPPGAEAPNFVRPPGLDLGDLGSAVLPVVAEDTSPGALTGTESPGVLGRPPPLRPPPVQIED